MITHILKYRLHYMLLVTTLSSLSIYFSVNTFGNSYWDTNWHWAVCWVSVFLNYILIDFRRFIVSENIEFRLERHVDNSYRIIKIENGDSANGKPISLSIDQRHSIEKILNKRQYYANNH